MDSLSNLIVGGKYRLSKRIGSGSFGVIYLGSNITTGEEVGIKLEEVRCRHPQLFYESKIYRYLQGGIGIPNIYWYGVEGDFNVMVIDLLGPSLEDLMNLCNRRIRLENGFDARRPDDNKSRVHPCQELPASRYQA